MPILNEEGLPTQAEILAAIYRVAYAYAIDQLREGLHPDAIRLILHLDDGRDPDVASPMEAAGWRGLEDALEGRPSSPHSVINIPGHRRWRRDPGPTTLGR